MHRFALTKKHLLIKETSQACNNKWYLESVGRAIAQFFLFRSVLVSGCLLNVKGQNEIIQA